MRHVETPAGKACRETRDAQDADRVLRKGGGDMSQNAVVEVVLAAVGVDQLAVRRFSYNFV